VKFKKRPVIIEAEQWMGIFSPEMDWVAKCPTTKESFFPEKDLCKHCTLSKTIHGWIETLEGGHIVCPFDWIITGIKGEKYPCKPDIFHATYERID
jgi:hypothetical protein